MSFSHGSEIQNPNAFVSYGAVELIRLLTNIDKKLYVIIKKLEILGQPETDEVLKVDEE